MSQFYNHKEKKSYKELSIFCKKCGWSGIGEQAKEGMDSSRGFPLLCPKCDGYIEWVDITVSIDDLLNYGTEKDQKYAQKRLKFLKKVREKELKTPDQLPDIDADEIIITLCEEENNSDDAHIVLYWQNQELWREIRSFEYYPRYLELGNLLKQKYGNRLVDFVTEYTVYLGGDCLSAFDKVRQFRKSLSKK